METQNKTYINKVNEISQKSPLLCAIYVREKRIIHGVNFVCILLESSSFADRLWNGGGQQWEYRLNVDDNCRVLEKRCVGGGMGWSHPEWYWDILEGIPDLFVFIKEHVHSFDTEHVYMLDVNDDGSVTNFRQFDSEKSSNTTSVDQEDVGSEIKNPYDITLYIRSWSYKAFTIAVTVNDKEYEIYDNLEELNKFPPVGKLYWYKEVPDDPELVKAIEEEIHKKLQNEWKCVLEVCEAIERSESEEEL